MTRFADENKQLDEQGRSADSNKINFHNIVKRRRAIGEIAGRRISIRNHCLECMGYASHEVKACTAAKCWMYPWRMGALEGEEE